MSGKSVAAVIAIDRHADHVPTSEGGGTRLHYGLYSGNIVTHHLTHAPHLAHTFGVSTTVTNEAVELYINCIIARFFVAVL
jgi:hypothetical protein